MKTYHVKVEINALIEAKNKKEALQSAKAYAIWAGKDDPFITIKLAPCSPELCGPI